MSPRRAFYSLLVSILLSFALPAPPTQACSGWTGPALRRELFIDSDLIVSGEFVEVDDANKNGILRVEQVLNGVAAPQYLLLALNEIHSVIDYVVEQRILSGGCYYTWGHFEVGQAAVAFLQRRPDGAYAATGLVNGVFAFETPETTLRFSLGLNAARSDMILRDFKFNELVDYVLNKTRVKPQPPRQGDPYPLKAPLMLLRSDQSRLLVPVDGSKPIPMTPELIDRYVQPPPGCSTPPCYAASPNGLDRAEVIRHPSEQTITTFYYPPLSFIGDALLFSSTSDALAAWSDSRIEVYALWYPRLGYSSNERTLINSVLLERSESVDHWPGRAAWSPDGRMLAFSDARGLWLWDVFDQDSTPRLLVETMDNVVPLARHFSPQGRYLAVQGQERFHLDLVNDQRLPDGLISSDDRVLLHYATETLGEFEFRVEHLAPFRQIHPDAWGEAHKVAWIDRDLLLFARCEVGFQVGEGQFVLAPQCHVIENDLRGWGQWLPGFAFDYQPQLESIATLIDDDTIAIDSQRRTLDVVQMPRLIDIEWLRPLFYFRGMENARW